MVALLHLFIWWYGKASSVVFEHLANLLSIQRNTSYSSIMSWLRCYLSFSSIMCIHGSRSSSGLSSPVDLVIDESRVSTVCDPPSSRFV